MNKKETAEFLGISTRLVERYAKDGRLGERKYVRGKTGKIADFDREDVEKLKAELSAPATLAPIALNRPNASEFVALLTEAIKGEKPRTASVRISEKLLLTKDEARQLSGLPGWKIDEVIESGELKSEKMRSRIKIKRSDLDEFVNNL